MKVFISWSGDRSKKVAELLNEWLQCVIQAIDPWMSSKDIDRGSLWFTEINDQLANTTVGIVCITKENRNKPWILFESGALAKGLSSNRVCTFLIDLVPTDLQNPLAQFNHTLPNREGVWSLVRTINSSLKDLALKAPVLEKVLDTYWPQFDRDFQAIIKATPEGPTEETRKEPEILLEVLSAVRGLEKRMRSIESRSVIQSRENSIEDSTVKLWNKISVRGMVRDLAKLRVPPSEILDQGIRLGIPQHLMLESMDEVLTTPLGEEHLNSSQPAREWGTPNG